MMMARQFNRPDWRRMLSEISSTEYIEWCRHFGEYPVDYHINQFAMGRVCATILMPHCGADSTLSPSDFYYNPPERPVQSSEEMATVASSIPGLESFQ